MIRFEIRMKSGGSIEQLAARISDLSPVTQRAAEILRGETLRNFREGGVFPAKWEPSQRVKKHGGQTLVQRSILRNSISPTSTPTTAAIGTAVKYAAIHQFGGTISLPPRTMAHRKTGRFMSRRAAAKAKDPVRISFSPARQISIPARPFLPVDAQGTLSPDAVRRIGGVAVDYALRGA